jgi:hypothetical protein
VAKTKTKKANADVDMVYLLKLTVYLILGSIWVKVTDGQTTQFPIPAGFLMGLLLVSHDRVQIDRKIGFAVLLIAMLIGFWAPFGIYVVT